jgi:hypothetical protein
LRVIPAEFFIIKLMLVFSFFCCFNTNKEYELRVTVKDADTLNFIQNTDVRIGEKAGKTDTNGFVKFKLEN